ncbi:hypothetical protein [Streptomyces europaeiscabiei]|uniref:hypothetical protein n=1 Tax=Streptomyces europaeiscabiei TaxID=146819 RepID=UPI0038F782B0
MSKLYDEFPADVVAACVDVLHVYTAGQPLSADLELLRSPAAMLFAEATALEAVELLGAEQGSSSDLHFSDLFHEPLVEPLTPPMLPLLGFLRARLAGQNPVLRLDPAVLEPALTLLLLAAQALVSAAGEQPEPARVEELLQQCLTRLTTDPADQRTPPGELLFGLTPDGLQEADEEGVLRDQLATMYTGAVPVLRRLRASDGAVVLALDLNARPDLADVFRHLITNPPAEGADTSVHWQGFAVAEMGLVRLSVEWLQPVHAELAVVLRVDQDGRVLRAIADSDQLGLTDGDHRDSGPTDQLRIPSAARALSGVLSQVADALHR